MTREPHVSAHVCRRTVLRGAAVAAGSCLLAACGGSSEEPATGPLDGAAAGPGGGEAGSAAPSAGSLASLSSIDVGSAKQVKAGDQDVILVRTSKTEVQGLSAVCPHKGCSVAPDGDVLVCPCHGSRFRLDGAVVQGPATRDLEKFPVAVSGDSVVAD